MERNGSVPISVRVAATKRNRSVPKFPNCLVRAELWARWAESDRPLGRVDLLKALLLGVSTGGDHRSCSAVRGPPRARASASKCTTNWWMDESTAREALEAERVSASGRVMELRTEFDWLAGDSEDANGDDEHDPEGSTLAFERARVAALLADAESTLEDLDRALAKLTAGTFARCEVCGGEIPQSRIEALPATRTCIGCAPTAGRR